MSAFLFNRLYFDPSIVGGEFRQTTDKVQGLLRHIIVESKTDSTNFDFSISDGSSVSLFERESAVGTLNELVQIPLQSKLVLRIFNATVDEVFKIYIAVQEK